MIGFFLDLLFDFLFDMTIADWVGKRIERKRTGRNRRRRRLRCSVRVDQGSQDGVGPRWRRRRTRLETGRMVFGRRVIDVVAVDGSWVRELGWRELWRLDPKARILHVTTPTARLEWAVNVHDIGWATGAVSPGRTPSPMLSACDSPSTS